MEAEGNTPSSGASAVDFIEFKIDERSAAGNICITIADSGRGIPSNALNRVFDPLFTTKAGGTLNGTGLFSVQRIIAEHGGIVQAANSHASGAMFTICLPRQASS